MADTALAHHRAGNGNVMLHFDKEGGKHNVPKLTLKMASSSSRGRDLRMVTLKQFANIERYLETRDENH